MQSLLVATAIHWLLYVDVYKRQFQDIFVNDKADMVFRIIHQAEDADRTRGDIEILLHMCGIGKGKTGTSHFLGKYCGAEFLVTGHHQKVKAGFLGIAEKQVLADADVQKPFHLMAAFDCLRRVVINPRCV